MQLSIEEQKAIAHVKERVKKDGEHSITGCPRYCRAMCRYGKIIKQLQKRGYSFKD